VRNWIRRAVSAAAIVGGIAVAFHSTSAQEPSNAPFKERLKDGGIAWLNSGPLSSASLRGKVVLVDFWTYSCINSLRNLPYMQAWAEKYKDAGLVVVGVHTPEFRFEHERANVERAVHDLNVTYPVVLDSNYTIWGAFDNNAWPADYIVDGNGRIRYTHLGEGDYVKSERVIQKLLKENGAAGVSDATVSIHPEGIEAPPNFAIEQSPETYVGYHRAEEFASPERVTHDAAKTYSTPTPLSLNEWALGGSWSVGAEYGTLASAPGKIAFRFHSRDLHLVMGSGETGRSLRYTVKVDGAAPGNDHGVDTAGDGSGEVREPRCYQLIRQKGQVKDRTFEIDFLDPGVRAYVFTFG
jgi:thiol-disulfide isomerase/thioredoxin